jgi:hypothetical protein
MSANSFGAPSWHSWVCATIGNICFLKPSPQLWFQPSFVACVLAIILAGQEILHTYSILHSLLSVVTQPQHDTLSFYFLNIPEHSLEYLSIFAS